MQERDIFPLRDSIFEGMHVKIPFEYSWLLEEEYGKKALTVTRFENHRWNETSKLWDPLPSYGMAQRKGPRRKPWRGGPSMNKPWMRPSMREEPRDNGKNLVG